MTFLFLMFVLFVIAVFVSLVPGYLATKRKHAYKNVIWVLGIVGLVNGVTWFVAMVWALWPQEKSLIDPVLGNVTGTGVRSIGDTIGSVTVAVPEGVEGETKLRDEIKKAKSLYDEGIIDENEYQRKREKILDL